MSRTSKYALQDEHRAQLKPWADRWISIAMSTKAMDDADRVAMRVAVRGLYEAAGLKPPPEHRIVFVPSPFVLRFAGGIAAAIWHIRRDATYAATRAATLAATYAATLDATYAATRDATLDATLAATRAATLDATYAATRAATLAATYAATYDDKWYIVNGDLAACVKSLLPDAMSFGLDCVRNAWRMWQGGNQWSAWAAFLSFFRHVAQLPLDYSKWLHWESAATHGGPRIMHPEFCMISDRPERLTVDDRNLPHAADGPFCRWRDGSALFAWHGVRVPAKYYLREHTAREILAEQNVEVRRAMIERYDEQHEKGAWLRDVGAKVLDTAIQPMRPGAPESINELLSIDIPDDPDGRMVGVRVIDPSTGRQYVLRVHPELRPMRNGRLVGRPQSMTVRNAIASTFGLHGEEYALEQES